MSLIKKQQLGVRCENVEPDRLASLFIIILFSPTRDNAFCWHRLWHNRDKNVCLFRGLNDTFVARFFSFKCIYHTRSRTNAEKTVNKILSFNYQPVGVVYTEKTWRLIKCWWCCRNSYRILVMFIISDMSSGLRLHHVARCLHTNANKMLLIIDVDDVMRPNNAIRRLSQNLTLFSLYTDNFSGSDAYGAKRHLNPIAIVLLLQTCVQPTPPTAHVIRTYISWASAAGGDEMSHSFNVPYVMQQGSGVCALLVVCLFGRDVAVCTNERVFDGAAADTKKPRHSTHTHTHHAPTVARSDFPLHHHANNQCSSVCAIRGECSLFV